MRSDPSIGRPLRRTEDARLITGQGRYVDDIRSDGSLHVAFVRSPEAHACIEAIDTDDAAGVEGVIGVFTSEDLGLERAMPNAHPIPPLDGRQAPPLATHEVCHAGVPVVAVVARSPAIAADAAERVWIDYRSLPAVTDVEQADAPGAALVMEGTESNLVISIPSSFGDIDRAFEEASVTFSLSLRQHRGACASMEPRGVLAAPTEAGITLWVSTQGPLASKRLLGEYFGRSDIRVIAPDVGGGFGPKGITYPEEYVLVALADRLGKPVKWIETRREHFLTTNQQRDMVAHLEAAATDDGILLGLRGRLLQDNGAYVPYGTVLAMTGIQLVQGPYRIEAMDLTLDMIATNAVPTSPIRGAARPNAIYIIERVMDAVADATGLDRFDVRRRNFIPEDAFPYEYPLPARYGGNLTYDSGNYHASLDQVSELADVAGFEGRRTEAAANGRLLGMGVAAYVEDTGLGPFEKVRVEIDARGAISVLTAATSQGQGHETVFAQICADSFGVDPGSIVVRGGDTDHPGSGVPTVASRTAVTAGSSTKQAADVVAEQAKRLAAAHLEASESDLVLDDGFVRVIGSPGSEVSLATLASLARASNEELATTEAFPTPRPPYAFGCHVVEVEVDAETGLVTIVRYSVSHDCGTLLNPMIVNGQIDGGVAHGLSNALLEKIVYSDEGQPLTTTFMDFRIPTAMEIPSVAKMHTVTPATENPLGAKGAGEGGTLPATAAVASAVEDALREYGVRVDRYPLTAAVVRSLLLHGEKRSFLEHELEGANR